MYSIGEVSEMFNLPISTIRYYDRKGLLPEIQRESGQRRFSDSEIDALQVIDCLKHSGLSIADIAQFMAWCQEGPSTYAKRLDLFCRQEQAIENEIRTLESQLALIQYKKWYYQTAIDTGSEDAARNMAANHQLPDEIQELYDTGFHKSQKQKS